MRKVTDQDRCDIEETWAKFASLFRDKADAESVVDAAVRFMTKVNEFGGEFSDLGLLSAKDLAVLGPVGTSMAAVSLVENVVRVALLEAQIKKISDSVLKLLSNLSSGMQAENNKT